VANKIDLPEAAENVRRLRDSYGGVFPISAVTGEGVKALLAELFRRLAPSRK
ncbi:unnamed protein product, partial [marine sediment metagenome]